MRRILSIIFISILSACASQSTQPTSSNDTTSRTETVTDPNLQPNLRDPSNILSKRSVYYDYDSSIIKNEYRPLVQAHALYLRDNAGAKVLLQGNTDERGSREYNLALGQKRSDSVKTAMMLAGVKDNQIESVSLGEEKPRAAGHDKLSWAENRRTDILYQGE